MKINKIKMKQWTNKEKLENINKRLEDIQYYYKNCPQPVVNQLEEIVEIVTYWKKNINE